MPITPIPAVAVAQNDQIDGTSSIPQRTLAQAVDVARSEVIQFGSRTHLLFALNDVIAAYHREESGT